MSVFKKFTADSDEDMYILSEEKGKIGETKEYTEDNEELKQQTVASDEASDDDDDDDDDEEAEEKPTGQKKRNRSEETLAKKKEKFAEMKRRRKERNEESKLNFNCEKMSLIEQAAYFWSYVIVENKNSQLDHLGMEFPLTEEYLQTYENPHEDDLLLRRIKSDNPEWKRLFTPKGKHLRNGSPLVIVICMSAIRCTELIKNLSSLGIFIPKLFGKHIKIDQQKDALKRYTPVAVGVPNRILKLVEEGILNLSSVTTIVIDMKENEKTMNVMSLSETREAMVKLYMHYLHNGVIHNTSKIVLW